MKNLKMAFVALLLICSSAAAPTAKAERMPEQKVVWIFYSAYYDMTVYYNPGMGQVISVDWPSHSVTDIGSSTGTTSYNSGTQVLTLSNFQVEADGVWQGISDNFVKQ